MEEGRRLYLDDEVFVERREAVDDEGLVDIVIC